MLESELMVILPVLGLIVSALIVYYAFSKIFKKPVETTLIEIAGELRLTYYPGMEGKPPFATGSYSGRGVTLDLLNEKGYMDRWHPHSRIVVSVDKNIKDTYIVANKGRFYSRKLGEINVKYPHFSDRFVYLSSSPNKAEKVVTDDVACWVMNLDMPFILSDGHIVYHQGSHFDDKQRMKHIVDALVYIANLAEKAKA
jgi:hypothetical protein